MQASSSLHNACLLVVIVSHCASDTSRHAFTWLTHGRQVPTKNLAVVTVGKDVSQTVLESQGVA